MSTVVSSEVIDSFLQTHAQWSRDNGQLVADFKFHTFDEAIEFVNAVVEIAQELNHHPDILLSFKKVTIATTTHSATGITQLDLDIITRIDNL